MAAPAHELEALVRDELRDPVSELVRQVVVELVREQLNGAAPSHPDPSPEPSTNGATVPAAAPTEAAMRHCKGCDRDLPLGAFSPGHYRCRECRNRANRERD